MGIRRKIKHLFLGSRHRSEERLPEIRQSNELESHGEDSGMGNVEEEYQESKRKLNELKRESLKLHLETVKLRREGHTQQEIAKITGYAQSKVSKILSEQ